MEKLMKMMEKGLANIGYCCNCGMQFWYVLNFKNTHCCPECGNKEGESLMM